MKVDGLAENPRNQFFPLPLKPILTGCQQQKAKVIH